MEAINNDQNKQVDGKYVTLKLSFKNFDIAQKAKDSRIQLYIDHISKKKEFFERRDIDNSRIKINLFNKGELSDSVRSKINILFKISETKNKGNCTVKFYEVDDMNRTIKIFEEFVCDGKNDVLGDKISVSKPIVSKKQRKMDLFISGLHNYIDEKFVKKFIKKIFKNSGNSMMQVSLLPNFLDLRSLHG